MRAWPGWQWAWLSPSNVRLGCTGTADVPDQRTPAEHKAYLHRSGRTGQAGASGVVVTLQTPAQAGDVRALMRKARIVPLAATARPGSALLRSIAGVPAKSPAPQPYPAGAGPETTATASPATGHRAAAMSASYRRRRKR